MTPYEYAVFCKNVYDCDKNDTLDFHVGSFRAIFIRTDESLVISVAGTDNEEDLEVDIDLNPIYSNELGCFCHKGIWAAARMAWANGLYQKIQSFGSDTSIDITGHSLGGGEGILIAALMATARIPFRRLVTFNAPRVAMGLRLPKLIGPRSLIYRHAADLVSLLPPNLTGHIDGWQHPSPPITIGTFSHINSHALSLCIKDAPKDEIE